MSHTKTAARFFAVLVLSAFVAGCADCDQKYVDDTVVSDRVYSAIADDASLSSSQIHVETNLNVVTLTGSVDTVRSEARAVEIARDTDGSMGVRDALAVRWYRN